MASAGITYQRRDGLSQALVGLFLSPPTRLLCSQCGETLDVFQLTDGEYALGHLDCATTVIIHSLSMREVIETFISRGGNSTSATEKVG